MSGFPHQPHNWLIHKLMWEELSTLVPRYARGTTLDVGCGAAPYWPLFAPHVGDYIGIDYPAGDSAPTEARVQGDAMALPVADASVDTVLCSEVLEHLPEPRDAVREMERVLRPGGHVILTTPLFWQIHEEPRDYYRYTRYGLQHLLEAEGLVLVHTAELTGYVATAAQMGSYVLYGAGTGVRRWLALPVVWLWQRLAYALNPIDRSRRFNCLTIVVGRKPGAEG